MTYWLDVGCGIRNRASVRIDILKTKRNTLNVLASAEYLPFRNKVFERALCFHVFEHLKKPKQALKELNRVSKSLVVKIPFLFYHHDKRFNYRELGLKWSFRLDHERKRFGVPFRIELNSERELT